MAEPQLESRDAIVSLITSEPVKDETPPVVEGPEPTVPMLVLGTGDDRQEFATRGTIPQWAFFKLAVYDKQNDEMGQMAAVYDVITYLVTEADYPRLNQYLNTHGFELGELMEAISTVCKEIAGHPLDGSVAS